MLLSKGSDYMFSVGKLLDSKLAVDDIVSVSACALCAFSDLPGDKSSFVFRKVDSSHSSLCSGWLLTYVLTYSGRVTPYGNIDLDQLWLRLWLVVWRHQAITWPNVDLSSASAVTINWCHQSLKLTWKLLTKHFMQISQGSMS